MFHLKKENQVGPGFCSNFIVISVLTIIQTDIVILQFIVLWIIASSNNDFINCAL